MLLRTVSSLRLAFVEGVGGIHLEMPRLGGQGFNERRFVTETEHSENEGCSVHGRSITGKGLDWREEGRINTAHLIRVIRVIIK
jgi:hypothetical protein